MHIITFRIRESDTVICSDHATSFHPTDDVLESTCALVSEQLAKHHRAVCSKCDRPDCITNFQTQNAPHYHFTT